VNDRLLRDCLLDGIGKLGDSEAPHHRNDTVVTANSMKSKGKRDQPQARRGEPASPEVAYDHANSRDAVHFAQQSQRVFAGEMVQDLGAHDDVDTSVREGKSQRVTTDREPNGGPARAGELER
jgi:hypothetical protein